MFLDRPTPATPPASRLYHSVPTPRSYQASWTVPPASRGSTASCRRRTLVLVLPSSSPLPSGVFQVPSNDRTSRFISLSSRTWASWIEPRRPQRRRNADRDVSRLSRGRMGEAAVADLRVVGVAEQRREQTVRAAERVAQDL